jgi:hypothetical protein
VSTADDRDPHVKDNDDRLLKRSLAPRDTVPGEPCLDAETLAAWADGAASIDQVEAIERHLAACARCQAVLATFVGTEPADASAVPATGTPGNAASNVVPFRSRLISRWVPVALGAIAASLVIYAAWPAHQRTGSDRAEQTVASATPSQPVPPVQDSRGLANTATTPPAGTEVVTAERKVQGAGATKLPRQATPSELAAPVPAPRPLPAPPMPVIVTGASASNATIDGVRLATPLPPPTITITPTPTSAAAKPSEVVMLRSTADATKDPGAARVVAEFGSPTTTASGIGQSLIGNRAGGGAGGRGALVAGTPRPQPRVNWRVLASGAVERSANGGQTWTPVTIAPATPIVGGAAPSASVCWLIGRAGIVLLSTDGVTFRRVRSPDVADLRSILAIDELQATVTTIDGRVFTTIDGGDHWTE